MLSIVLTLKRKKANKLHLTSKKFSNSQSNSNHFTMALLPTKTKEEVISSNSRHNLNTLRPCIMILNLETKKALHSNQVLITSLEQLITFIITHSKLLFQARDHLYPNKNRIKRLVS
jgi:hypothetical protein